MEIIRQFINTITPMSDKDWLFFSSKLKKTTLKKKTTILKVQEKEEYLSFLEKGIVRYYIPKEENDITFGFSFENSFITGYDSFLTQLPSSYQIETLTEATLWRISLQDLEDVYKNTENGESIGRKMAENMFLVKSKRELSLLSKSAEERYLDLFAERPILLKQVPLKYIASYIGISPQALSRIRSRIS